MSNSGLVVYTKLSPNHSGKRKMAIDRITPHCVVGQVTVERLGEIFAPVERQASSNYGIGLDGKVALYVDEGNRSWCTSSNANDQRAVTIECASDTTEPYAFKDVVYNRLIDLCEDICKRNGKTKLLWFGDKDKTLNYSPAADEMVLTVHRWFANKSCPGNWMYARMGDLAAKVTSRLGGGSQQPSGTLYRVQTGAYKQKANAAVMAAKLKAAGFDTYITTEQGKAVSSSGSAAASLAVGDKVKLASNAPVYGSSTKFSSWVYSSTLYVREISGNRIVISTQKTGAITGAVDKKYLTKI